MKKKYIVAIVIILVLIIGIIGYFLYQKMIQEGRIYEVEKVENPQYFILKEQEKYGVINKQGNIIIEPVYQNIIIPNPEKGIFICYDIENTQVLNEKQEKILTQYQKVEPIRLKNIASSYMYEKTVLTYQKDEKIGLITLEGKELGKPIYEQIEALPYKEGELLVKQEGKFGVMNIKGNMLVLANYEQISIDNYYTEEQGYNYAGYIVSKKTEEGYRYGYVDRNGKEILNTEFNELSRIIDMKDNQTPYLITAKNGQYGVYKNEQVIINNEYQSIRYQSSNSEFIVEKSKKYGVADIEGKILIPLEYNQIDVTGIYLYARKGDITEVFDQNGKLTNRDSNIAIVQTENQQYKIKIDNTEGTIYSIVDKDENRLTKMNYTYIEYLYGEYFMVSLQNGKLGVIDAKENIKIEIQYDSIERIQNSELLKTTTQNNIMELYTPSLTKIIEMKDAILEVKDQYIKLYNDTQTKYFEYTGKQLENTQILTNQKLYAKEKDGKWGFIDQQSRAVVENQYEKVTEFNQYGFAGIKKEGKWGVINESGNIIIEPVYEFSSSIEPSFIDKYYQVVFGFGEIYYTDER